MSEELEMVWRFDLSEVNGGRMKKRERGWVAEAKIEIFICVCDARRGNLCPVMHTPLYELQVQLKH